MLGARARTQDRTRLFYYPFEEQRPERAATEREARKTVRTIDNDGVGVPSSLTPLFAAAIVPSRRSHW